MGLLLNLRDQSHQQRQMTDHTLVLEKKNTKQSPKCQNKIEQTWPKKRGTVVEKGDGLREQPGGLNKHQGCRSRKGGPGLKKGDGRLVGIFRHQERVPAKGVLAQKGKRSVKTKKKQGSEASKLLERG